MGKIIDWLFSHVEYEEPEEIYHYEKIHFKTYLRTYCGILTINKPDNEYQLKVFIGEPYFKDGTKKYINEADLIDETDWQPLENAKQIIQDAHNIIKAYEVKERVLAYFKLKRNFIVLKNEEDGETSRQEEKPRPQPVTVHDWRDEAYANYTNYLSEHPEEIDLLEPKERERILKDNPEIRIKYYEWKALQAAQERQKDGK